jgi:hypothetical protein
MAKRPTKTAGNSSLLEALEFIEPVMKEDGTPPQTHVILNQKYAFAYDGILSMAHPIDEELAICPQFYSLKAALKRAKETVSISVNNDSLSVKSGRLRVTVPCVAYNQMMVTQPDTGLWATDNTIVDGFKLLVGSISEKDDRVITSTLNLTENVMIVTDGAIYLEYWHGFKFSPMIVPKRVISVVSKINKKLVGIGATRDRSITFYFENGAWVKSQLAAEPWPNVDFISSVVLTNPKEYDSHLIEAVESVLPHSPEKAVYFSTNCVRSHHADQGDTGAKFDIDNIETNAILNGEMLLTILKMAKQIQFDVQLKNTPAFGFYGDKVRGFLAYRSR